MNDPLLVAVSIVAGLYFAKLWQSDRRAWRAGQSEARALPGATDAPWRAVLIAVLGGFILVALETVGEIRLGIASEQSTITWLFALNTIIAAPIIEEVIFRGWLLIQHRGPAVMWLGILGASLLFALLHPFLWRWDDAGFALTLGAKGWFSTSIVFLTSLWLYATRVNRWNPQRSLLPCFAGHAAKNLGVVIVKFAGGYVQGVW